MNPYSKTYTNRAGDDILAGNKNIHAPRSAEPIVASNGDINAGSRAELMQRIGELMTLSSTGAVKSVETEMTRAEKKSYLATAYAQGTHSDAWMAVGDTMAAEVKETLGREGFARKLMQFKNLNNGDALKVRLRRRDSRAYVTTNNTRQVASIARVPFAQPDMFNLTCNINVDAMEIAQDTGDLLDDRYNDGLEQMLVGEDKVFKLLADKAATALNTPFYFSDFTPTTLTTMRSEILSNGGIPVTSMLISFDIWNDIIAQPEFTAWYSEIAKHELVLEGNLGVLAGMNIITDGYRIETLKVLEPGSVYMFGNPETLGVIGQWGDMSVKPVDKANDGQAKVGWFMSSIEAMVIGNARAVVRGNRL